MRVLPHVLYLMGALPTLGGILILAVLAPKPTGMLDHLHGLARYLVFGGVVFGTARVLSGWRPSWDLVLLMVGIGIGIAFYARDTHLRAIRREMAEDEEQESCA